MDAIVDESFYDALSKHNWHAKKGGYTYYAVRKTPGRRNWTYMHREILGILDERDISCDHINLNGLDNRIANIRKCSHQQNCCNRIIRKKNIKHI